MIYPAKNDGSHLHARGCRFARSMFSSVLSVPKPELCLAKTFPVAALGGGKKLMVQVKKEKKQLGWLGKDLGISQFETEDCSQFQFGDFSQ